MLKKATERFEQRLAELHEGLSRPRTHKKIETIWKRIGQLKANSSGAGQHYHIEVVADQEGANATAIKWQQRPVAGSKLTHPGVYCLRSNQTDWAPETMWRTYIMLTDLEAVFRSLKSELGLRPDLSPEAASCQWPSVQLAYQLVQVIRRHLGAHALASPLRSGGQQRVTWCAEPAPCMCARRRTPSPTSAPSMTAIRRRQQMRIPSLHTNVADPLIYSLFTR